MSSRPPFVVEINKGGEKTLAIHCVFPHPVMAPPPMEQDQEEEQDQGKEQHGMHCWKFLLFQMTTMHWD